MRLYFYPRPPRGGRPVAVCRQLLIERFLSTPSARRATRRDHADQRLCDISIHALREEGDGITDQTYDYVEQFLSTPSARRATGLSVDPGNTSEFLSTPSARRATHGLHGSDGRYAISIHALREEGDPRRAGCSGHLTAFLSTPSARRATTLPRARSSSPAYFYPRPPRGGRRRANRVVQKRKGISIHALREEGDLCCRICNQKAI